MHDFLFHKHIDEWSAKMKIKPLCKIFHNIFWTIGATIMFFVMLESNKKEDVEQWFCKI